MTTPDDFDSHDTLPTGAPTVDPYDAVPPGEEVPRARTPLTMTGLVEALIGGHRHTYGTWPSPERVRAATCMLGVEHGGVPPGETRASPAYHLWCNNVGNVDAGGAWQGDWFSLTADEVIRGKRAPMTKRLRAHADATTGAADYWDLLKSKRFTWDAGDGLVIRALDAADQGDLDGFARSLKAGRWFTGPVDGPDGYIAGMTAWAKVYDRSFGI